MRSYFCCLASSVKHLRNVDEVKLSLWPYLDRSHQVTWFFNNIQAVESDDLYIIQQILRRHQQLLERRCENLVLPLSPEQKKLCAN